MTKKSKKATDLIAQGATARNKDGCIERLDLSKMDERDRALFMAGWHWQDERLNVIVPLQVEACKVENGNPEAYNWLADGRADGPMACNDGMLDLSLEIRADKIKRGVPLFKAPAEPHPEFGHGIRFEKADGAEDGFKHLTLAETNIPLPVRTDLGEAA